MSHDSSRLGVDTGGTFTDFVWQSPEGRLVVYKVRSTPNDPSQAIVSGIAGLNVPDQAAVIHGSTVATNALLERRGARTALITTAGFEDVLAIGRQNRPGLYDLVPHKPTPLVPARRRLGVAGRLGPQGEIVEPLNKTRLNEVFEQLVADRVESVAVVLLFSYLDDHQERQIAAAFEDWAQKNGPQQTIFLSLSAEIIPEYREYERTVTTVINAYVVPLMSRYLAALDQKVAPRTLAVMQSNGGLIQAEMAGRQAARTALSGPAGGVVGAFYVAQQAGYSKIITFDMGGTSTDVALCPGRLPTTTRGSIADMPLRLPIIDIHTVGAGGGSIASLDPAGALHVGPESAGADPGPACYPRVHPSQEVLQPTVTDAHLALGRLDQDRFLGGNMRLDLAAANRALKLVAADTQPESITQAAQGVINVANAHMERAIRKISVERGYDPRDFVLLPFGGAGPLHACELATGLNIGRILIPPYPGVLSALGMLAASPAKNYSQTILTTIMADDLTDAAWLGEKFEPLLARAAAEMAAENYVPETITYARAADMRYRGQSHELSIALPPDNSPARLAELLHRAHRVRYGYDQPGEAVELVTIRLTATAAAMPVTLPELPAAGDPVETAEIGRQEIWVEGQAIEAALYERTGLQPGHRFYGPAVVFQYDTTIFVAPGWEAAVDRFGNIILSTNP